ncbi:Protein of unknown function DUF2800 [uncultured Caudovirales phage]|uniref:Uncharacterized protein n=1 Tax=uncultured Caudovirales phage TaxID=2100421 RepID=A0A6J5PFJ8_9CAUD|nr:Protein of unknown function DUF2800 [uncultured Caudovirales phage]CAB4197458.1 Protein of unknown function DUF2800 [uncultured Caudovirales phage]CAB4210580.1 Protein of unknown function DUF2800 [uncultured Caudovirales phage]
MGLEHSERRHSKFSASGAERWTNCSGSVELSEGLPDKSSVYSIEGTTAHEVLEFVLDKAVKTGDMPSRLSLEFDWKWQGSPNKEMITHAVNTAEFLLRLHERTPGSEFLVETRVHLPFIHKDMFGTFDSAVVEHFGTLHVFDYKYGAGHAVSPVKNLQMIFYGMALAAKYDWNFKRVRLWIIQPRIKGYDGPMFWEIPTAELKTYVDKFKAAVKRVQESPLTYVSGAHCHWCKAKAKCPITRQNKINKAQSVFTALPEEGINGEEKEESFKEENFKSEGKAARERQKEKEINRAFSKTAQRRAR